jgi:hypothetical protein
MTTSLKRTTLATLLSLAIGVPLAAGAADKPMTATGAQGAQADHKTYSDRANMKTMMSERDALEKAMPAGQKADFYRSKLTSMGWKITATNDAEPDYIEYEAVKGRNSVEVQIDRDKATGVASKVDVAPNIWRADSTKAALKGEKFEPMATAKYSDRKYAKTFSDEKEALKKALPAGHDKNFYGAKLKELGYTVTSTNEASANEVEWEVVKGKNSYEVQVDFDASTHMAKDIDVTANLWESDATERALGQK